VLTLRGMTPINTELCHKPLEGDITFPGRGPACAVDTRVPHCFPCHINQGCFPWGALKTVLFITECVWNWLKYLLESEHAMQLSACPDSWQVTRLRETSLSPGFVDTGGVGDSAV